MKQPIILFAILSLITVVGCSTTNRQIIIECGGSCSKTTGTKQSVVVSSSSTNSYIRVTPTK